MSYFNGTEIQHRFAAVVGAVLLSTLCVVAAVGPASAVEPSPMDYAQAAPTVDRHQG